MPSTNSLAMPISMPRCGYFSRSLRQAVRAARKSASPAAPVVSMSMPSAPASIIASATKSMSSTSIPQASTWASRASSILPRGSSSDQFGMGPSGFEYRPRSGMAPYCTGFVSSAWAIFMLWPSCATLVLTALYE